MTPPSTNLRMANVLRILLALALVGGAAATNWWVGAPPSFAWALLLTGAALVPLASARLTQAPAVQRWGSSCLLGLSTLAVVSLLGHVPMTTGWRDGHAVAAWLMAAATWLAAPPSQNASSLPWGRRPALLWCGAGVVVSLATGYAANRGALFAAGVCMALLTLALTRAWFRLGPLAIQAVNTLILLLLVLPLADRLLFPATHREQPPSPGERPYSYDVASRDPGSLVRWWRSYQSQEDTLFSSLFAHDRTAPPRLRPGASTTFFQSQISINQLGFRGADFPLEKGPAYRIVALGESTTFGLTLDPTDRPWPELLEQIIRDRLEPDRPVQVINAGIPGNTLEENLARWSRDILPLKPDLLISYHGANGFHFLSQGIRPLRGRAPPLYRLRPLRLLADLEYALETHWFKRHHFPDPNPEPEFVSPSSSVYAKAYLDLIGLAHRADARLVLATYSMAVNQHSDPAVVAFYEQRFPALRWQIEANALHTHLVQTLGEQHPDVLVVDTHPPLNGQHDHYIDIMHFNADGRRLMAEAMFQGIEPVLQKDLAP